MTQQELGKEIDERIGFGTAVNSLLNFINTHIKEHGNLLAPSIEDILYKWAKPESDRNIAELDELRRKAEKHFEKA